MQSDQKFSNSNQEAGQCANNHPTSQKFPFFDQEWMNVEGLLEVEITSEGPFTLLSMRCCPIELRGGRRQGPESRQSGCSSTILNACDGSG